MSTAVRIAVLVLIAAALLPAVAGACPTCKDATSDAETPGGSADLGRGFFWSILLMLAAPFSVIGGGAFAIVRARRRRAREGPAGEVSPMERRPPSGGGAGA